jgi:hypothetical protein
MVVIAIGVLLVSEIKYVQNAEHWTADGARHFFPPVSA